MATPTGWQVVAAAALLSLPVHAQLTQPLELRDGPALARLRTWPTGPSTIQGGFVDFTAEASPLSPTTDVLHEIAWAYRLPGDAHNRLFHSGGGQLAVTAAAEGWLGALTWTSVDTRGFGARLDVAVQATEPLSGSARFVQVMTITNPQPQPLSIEVFAYVDVDNFGGSTDRIDLSASGNDRIAVATVGQERTRSEVFAAPSPSSFETDRWSGNLRNRMLQSTGSAPYDLLSAHRAGVSNLDVTVAFQWGVVVPGSGGTVRLEVVCGRNDLACGRPANVVGYGSPVADSLGRVPRLVTVRGPVAGAEQQLDVVYAPGASGALLFGDRTSLALCGLEVLVAGVDFPLQLDASGRLELVFPASAALDFCGVTAHMQALLLAAPGGPCAAIPIVHTAGLTWVFGD